MKETKPDEKSESLKSKETDDIMESNNTQPESKSADNPENSKDDQDTSINNNESEASLIGEDDSLINAFSGGDHMRLASLQAELARARDELEAATEKELRMQAEIQNIRRRNQNDIEKTHKFGNEKILLALLPLIDSLERGAESAKDSDSMDALLEGMDLTIKLFVDTLKKFDIEQINPEGQPFDPQLHQAMSQVKSEEDENGTVLNVVEKGYVLHGRLLRPATVIVVKN